MNSSILPAVWQIDPRYRARLARADYAGAWAQFQARVAAGQRPTRPQQLVLGRGERIEGVQGAYRRDGVAIMRVAGPTFYRADSEWNEFLAWIFEGTITEQFARELATVAADDATRGILIEFDTPGGEAAGNHEVSRLIREVAGRKPTKAIATGLCCSAGYYLAAATSEVIASPTSELGSIGTLIHLVDDSGLLEQFGIKEYVITNRDSPDKYPDAATAKGRAQYQRHADAWGAMFIDDVAAYRGVTVAKVLDDFGKGDWMLADEAVKVGLADRVAVFERAVSEMVAETTPQPAVYFPDSPVAAAAPDVPLSAIFSDLAD